MRAGRHLGADEEVAQRSDPRVSWQEHGIQYQWAVPYRRQPCVLRELAPPADLARRPAAHPGAADR